VASVLQHVKSVLVVDDEPMILRAVARDIAVRRRGLSVHYAIDVAAACLAAAEAEDLDVAIVDLRLVRRIDDRFSAAESGLDVIRRLKTIRPHLIAVIWSGWLSLEAIDAARDAGAAFCRDKLTPVSHILEQLEGGTRSAVPADGTKTLARAEWEHIQRVLADSDNNVSEAARRLGILRSVLQRKLRRPPPSEFARKL
jgi:two-component system, response regulator RegA